MKKWLLLTVINACLATSCALGMKNTIVHEAPLPHLGLTLHLPKETFTSSCALGMKNTIVHEAPLPHLDLTLHFTKETLTSRLHTLSTTNSSRLSVVDSRITKDGTSAGYSSSGEFIDPKNVACIPLNTQEQEQLKQSLLSHIAIVVMYAPGASFLALDLAAIKPLPTKVHDAIYGAVAPQQPVSLPESPTNIQNASQESDKDSSNDSDSNSEENSYEHYKQDVPTILSDIKLTQQEYSGRVIAICNVPPCGITLCDSSKGDTRVVVPITSQEQQLLKQYLLSNVEAVVEKDLNEPKRLTIDLALLKQLPTFSAVAAGATKDAPRPQRSTLLQTMFNKTTLGYAACIVCTYLITKQLHSSNN